MALGRQNPADGREPFNMAYLAMHGSGAVNGVSRLHGKVSRTLFQPLFPRWPADEVPVGHVTNGVHVPTWDSQAQTTVDEACGQETLAAATADEMEAKIRRVSDSEYGRPHRGSRAFVEYARDRLSKATGRRPAGSPERVATAEAAF